MQDISLVLDLAKNKVGEAGHQLAQSIRSWGDEPPLQKLYRSTTVHLQLLHPLSLYNLCRSCKISHRIGFSRKQIR